MELPTKIKTLWAAQREQEPPALLLLPLLKSLLPGWSRQLKLFVGMK